MKKRALTLIEIMIVIMLITLISGAIGYNMKGALSKGKVFKTKQAKEQLHDQLLLCVDEGNSFSDVARRPEYYLKELGLAKNPKKLLEDGWGTRFQISVTSDNTDFKIVSPNLPDDEEE